MNWYIKLFLPLIAGGCYILVLLIFILSNSYPDDKIIGLTAIAIGLWGLIHPLYFPARPHKPSYRLLLILAISGYALFPVFILLKNVNGEMWILPLLLAAFTAVAAYFLRYKKKPYSLAPGWLQIKYICVMFSLGGWIVLLSYIFVLEVLNLRRFIPNEYSSYTFIFLIPWVIAHAFIAIAHYTEAITHHIRNSTKSWQKQIDNLGD